MTNRITACRFGVIMLRIFWWTTLAATIGLILSLVTMLAYGWPAAWGEAWPVWAAALAGVMLIESIIFWIGIITVYVTSVQLGLKIRVIGILCGWIPIANLIALNLIIRTVGEEVRFETAKERLDRSRAGARICATRYPVLLVHGVFFRDTQALNYWGRVPAELQRNGATIYYGEHQSAASVPDAARELTARIRHIVETTGCGKVNVIAHSKGGLDMRYAIARCGAAPYVASLTTINTPHRGCGFADYLLTNIPASAQSKVAATYNAAASRLGDAHPDFMAAVHDLTQAGCARLNAEIGDWDQLNGRWQWESAGGMTAAPAPSASPVPRTSPFTGIVCQSVGSKLAHATTGKFPLNFTYPLVKWFDGPNDGLVAQPSFPWGERFIWLEPNGVRGISHADMIDLNRENIPGFDVREFYVQIVAALKQRGL
ncbi:esterase/lipase family protein [Bifidobacterium myosotis]|uniref:Triacylglycerol lipase n=1 Tax=Bifidobacterium myosotis TaxID=1630166 RepID=A0A5M9ZNP8_9BIFI|nr:triacylglycerol lipase [Bifidobacterium myosotis]KAA8828462.1 triacylglycerol lipase [Bifidobacterium myosotis]